MANDEFHMMQHMCACMVDLSNEGLQVVARDETNPVSWPEIKVLQEVHGEDAVFDIRPVALAPRESTMREKDRMGLIYGREAVEAVYAGKAFVMEWFVPGWPKDPSKAKRNPPVDRPPRVKFKKSDDDAAVDAAV